MDDYTRKKKKLLHVVRTPLYRIEEYDIAENNARSLYRVIDLHTEQHIATFYYKPVVEAFANITL